MQNLDMNLNPDGAVLKISVPNLVSNINAIRKRTQAAIMGVVKCNGYGAGLVQLAQIYQDNGINWLGVCSPGEALALRQSNITANILLMVPQRDASILQELIKNDISIAVDTFAQLETIKEIQASSGCNARLHIAIDTGMHRYGFAQSELPSLAKALENIPVEGVFTHFSAAYQRKAAFLKKQLKSFDQAVSLLNGEGVCPQIIHAAGSLAALNFPHTHFDLIRCGSALLGSVPNPSTYGLKRVCCLEVPIKRIRELKQGQVLGYGGYKLKKSRTAALVMAGYADGIALERFVKIRNLRDLVHILKRPAISAVINGQAVPVIGGSGVNHCYLDITGKKAHEGDLARFYINPIFTSSQLPKVYSYDE